MQYILNEKYSLRPDENRVHLIQDDGRTYRFFVIHPVYAAVLSLFNGQNDIETIVDRLSVILSSPKSDIIGIINPLLENKDTIHIRYDGTVFSFPPMLLVKNESNKVRDDLKTEDCIINGPYDFKTLRFNRPKNCVIVINTKCYTDCVYCYANRKHVYTPLAPERLLSLIGEAHEIGIDSIEITGGEFFLYPEWKTLLKTILSYGYNPAISTKIPINESDIKYLSEVGLHELQVSLDTLNPSIVQYNLNVKPNYVEKMKKTLQMLDGYGISLIIKGTQTTYTCSPQNIQSILDFLAELKNVKRYVISTIGCSQNKPNDLFHQIKPRLSQISELDSFIKEVRSQYHFEIIFDDQSIRKASLCSHQEFNERALCTGNIDGFVILPDGKVTICEELYWHPFFILGDLTSDSILDVWHSDKAVKLWNLSQKDIPQTSACHKCSEFDECRHGLGVCWKMILAVYGKNNPLLPDPRCPQAPHYINDICYD